MDLASLKVPLIRIISLRYRSVWLLEFIAPKCLRLVNKLLMLLQQAFLHLDLILNLNLYVIHRKLFRVIRINTLVLGPRVLTFVQRRFPVRLPVIGILLAVAWVAVSIYWSI